MAQHKKEKKVCLNSSAWPHPNGNPCTLQLDEAEALRLADFLHLYHDASAARMGVSRPTFTKLLEKARTKVTRAALTGDPIVLGAASDAPVRLCQPCLENCTSCGVDVPK